MMRARVVSLLLSPTGRCQRSSDRWGQWPFGLILYSGRTPQSVKPPRKLWGFDSLPAHSCTTPFVGTPLEQPIHHPSYLHLVVAPRPVAHNPATLHIELVEQRPEIGRAHV